VDLDGFLTGLTRLTADDLMAVAHAIDTAHATVADEVEAWEDMMCVDGVLRRSGRSRLAARAAHDAVQAVRLAVGNADATVKLDDTVVVRVAREAALFARALVAGEGADRAVAHLMPEWGRIKTAA